MKKLVIVIAACVALCAAASAQEDSDILGEVKDGVYFNKVMGIQANFGKDWNVFTPSQIAALTGAVSSTSPTAKEILEKGMSFFLAMTRDGMHNINITADEINPMGKALIVESRDLFVNMHMDAALEAIRRANLANKLEDVVVERVSANFLNEKCPAVHMTGIYRKVPMYQKQVMLLTESFIFNITATSVAKDQTDEMFSIFRKSN